MQSALIELLELSDLVLLSMFYAGGLNRLPTWHNELISYLLLVAERGVVFFRAQAELDVKSQRDLIRRLSHLSERLNEDGLDKHLPSQVLGETDPELSVPCETATTVTYGKATPRNRPSGTLKWIPCTSYVSRTRLVKKMRACRSTSVTLTRIALVSITLNGRVDSEL